MKALSHEFDSAIPSSHCNTPFFLFIKTGSVSFGLQYQRALEKTSREKRRRRGCEKIDGVHKKRVKSFEVRKNVDMLHFFVHELNNEFRFFEHPNNLCNR